MIKEFALILKRFRLNDEKTFELFRAGDMTGIFQFESEGMRNALRLIRPNRFEDIFAINALYRPGPMDNIPLYSRRKNDNEKITYIHPQAGIDFSGNVRCHRLSRTNHGNSSACRGILRWLKPIC